ncbi:hypothetical protein D3C81_1572370 [compost metagenome]
MNKNHALLITGLYSLRVSIIKRIPCKNNLYSGPSKPLHLLNLLIRRRARHKDFAVNPQSIAGVSYALSMITRTRTYNAFGKLLFTKAANHIVSPANFKRTYHL